MSDRFDSKMTREELIETRKFAATLAREFIDPRVKYPTPGEVLDAAKQIEAFLLRKPAGWDKEAADAEGEYLGR